MCVYIYTRTHIDVYVYVYICASMFKYIYVYAVYLKHCKSVTFQLKKFREREVSVHWCLHTCDISRVTYFCAKNQEQEGGRRKKGRNLVCLGVW